MSLRTMSKKLGRLETLVRRRNDRNTVVLEALATDPVRILTDAGMEPDPWQEGVLRSDASRLLLLASRQAGKSSVAAALALQTALLRPRSPVLLLSPSLRQSGELYRKIVDLFGALGRPMGVTAESALRLELANGSRVVSLPGDEKNIRGFSGVALLVIDEAARVADSLYYAVRPMLAVSRGRLVALSTPFGKRGWYHDEWHGEGTWERVKITAEQCSRISPEFLAEERRALGERWYRQEYLCFPGDTDVITLDGVKPICEVRVGDYVLGHSNRYRKVLRTMERPYAGTMVRITTCGHSRPIVCTPEHPLGVHIGDQTYAWRQAQDIKEGDELTFNRLSPRKTQPLTEEWVRLLGWYIAEGSAQKNAVTFNLGHSEQQYAEEVLGLLQSTIGVKGTLRGVPTGLVVQANSVELKELLIRWCGRKQGQRQIPMQLISGHEKALLDTLMKGDGCEWRGPSPRDQYTTISKTLAYQVQMLFHQLGRSAAINVREKPEGAMSTIQGRSVAVQTSYAVVARIPKHTDGRWTRIRCRKYRVTAPVRRVEFVENWSGKVFNMEVEYDNSYTANGRIVHNCSFEDTIDAVFSWADIQAALSDDVKPLFPEA